MGVVPVILAAVGLGRYISIDERYTKGNRARLTALACCKGPSDTVQSSTRYVPLLVKAFTEATVGSPRQVIGIDRSEPETDEATADVDDRVGAFH